MSNDDIIDEFTIRRLELPLLLQNARELLRRSLDTALDESNGVLFQLALLKAAELEVQLIDALKDAINQTGQYSHEELITHLTASSKHNAAVTKMIKEMTEQS